ncbi:hypothetical protein BDR04DRAFT_1097872 [Suillus decipiens]|nr:hypothetical protein BDR04DRAFT_1097872 [Suillus decipiens]
MQRSTASPSAAVQSADNDCIASQCNDTNKTPAQIYTLNCGRSRCPVIFVYDVGTDWPTVSRLLDDHWLVCRGGFYELSHLPPRSDPNDPQYALSPPQLGPSQLGIDNSDRDDQVIAGGRKWRKEGQRRQKLENDEYTEDVQPTSVRCRGCQKAIKLDKRSRYYPGLWVKHRGKCPGIQGRFVRSVESRAAPASRLLIRQER